MSMSNGEAQEHSEEVMAFKEAMSPRTPVFFGTSQDPDDPGQPQNIAAVVAKYLSPARREHPEHMRNFSLRMNEVDLLRLSLLAEGLGVGKTALARELLDKAISEAYRSLPDDLRQELNERFADEI